MRLSRGESLTAVSVGVAVSAFVVVVGLVVPVAHPVRDQVDNALLWLGVIGLLNAGLMWQTRLLHDDRTVRALIGAYAVASAVAAGLADFDEQVLMGWLVKAGAVVVLALILWSLRRRA